MEKMFYTSIIHNFLRSDDFIRRFETVGQIPNHADGDLIASYQHAEERYIVERRRTTNALDSTAFYAEDYRIFKKLRVGAFAQINEAGVGESTGPRTEAALSYLATRRFDLTTWTGSLDKTVPGMPHAIYRDRRTGYHYAHIRCIEDMVNDGKTVSSRLHCDKPDHWRAFDLDLHTYINVVMGLERLGFEPPVYKLEFEKTER